MDITQIVPWLSATALIISIGGTVYAVLTARSKGNEARIGDVEKRLDGHRERIQSLEQELKHLPAKDEVHALQLSMTTIDGKVSTLTTSHDALLKSIRRIEDFLLKPKT